MGVVVVPYLLSSIKVDVFVNFFLSESQQIKDPWFGVYEYCILFPGYLFCYFVILGYKHFEIVFLDGDYVFGYVAFEGAINRDSYCHSNKAVTLYFIVMPLWEDKVELVINDDSCTC